MPSSIIIIGYPSSGKQLLGQKLADELQKTHIHLKTLFDEHNSFHAPMAKDFSTNQVLTGEMLADVLTWDLSKKCKSSQNGLVITSPRSVEQAMLLDNILAEHQMPAHVLLLESTLRTSIQVLVQKNIAQHKETRNSEIERMRNLWGKRKNETQKLITYYQARVLKLCTHSIANPELLLKKAKEIIAKKEEGAC